MKFDKADIVYVFLIKWKKAVYQCEIVNKDFNVFIYVHSKTTPIKDDNTTLVYDIIPTGRCNYSSNIFNPRNKIEALIRDLIVSDKIFYQNNMVGDYVNSFLNSCKGL